MKYGSDLDGLILGALQEGPMHGYLIAKRLKEASDLLSVGEGKLYPTLHRLEAEGHIAAEWVPQEGKPNRKVYRLTESGTAALKHHRARWERFATGVSRLFAPQEASRC